MSVGEPGRVAEDYLTLIWKAGEWPGEEPATSGLADSLGVARSTVSATLKRLAAEELIEYEPYGRIGLTDAGTEIAVRIVRRHRLIETYLVQRLGLAWDEVHDEADRLEHAVSDLVLARMDAALGHPQVDPHGDPIPPHHPSHLDAAVPLTSVGAAPSVRVVRVSDRDPRVLRHLADKGVVVGTVLGAVEVADGLGLVGCRVGEERTELSLAVADAVYVVSDPAPG